MNKQDILFFLNQYGITEKEKAKVIKDNLEHYNFIEDVENVKHPFAISRIFLDFQENWDNYIEYRIVESEVK
ncbi:MAG: hypothetical protein IJ086_06825 [Clostridium sp.]|nr:hypothetical protein [Clostridium sp.]MBQ9298779.1 hypothetical protein [Clostridia bacterium]